MPMPSEIQARLAQLNQRLATPHWPDPAKPIQVLLALDAQNLYQHLAKAYSYDLIINDLPKKLQPIYGRLSIQVLKVATILAALDWCSISQDYPTIEITHMTRAIEIVNPGEGAFTE